MNGWGGGAERRMRRRLISFGWRGRARVGYGWGGGAERRMRRRLGTDGVAGPSDGCGGDWERMVATDAAVTGMGTIPIFRRGGQATDAWAQAADFSEWTSDGCGGEEKTANAAKTSNAEVR